MEQGTRQRFKLWLRSERAFGMNAVPWQNNSDASIDSFVESKPKARGVVARDAAIPPVAARANAAASGATRPAEISASTALFKTPTAHPAAPFSADLLRSEEKSNRLTALNNNEVRSCTKCRLCETRKNTVFGEGSVDANIFFIGEGPGENEDIQARPFVGRAGEMLNKWIAAMGLRREDVYIANIVKCRPPQNRVPMPDEVATCTPYLERQLEIIRPRVIVTLGLPSLKYMMNDPKLAMGKSRGTWRDWRGIELMPTFHPAYVLRVYTDETRAAVWSDLKMVMSELGMPVPNRT